MFQGFVFFKKDDLKNLTHQFSSHGLPENAKSRMIKRLYQKEHFPLQQ